MHEVLKMPQTCSISAELMKGHKFRGCSGKIHTKWPFLSFKTKVQESDEKIIAATPLSPQCMIMTKRAFTSPHPPSRLALEHREGEFKSQI